MKRFKSYLLEEQLLRKIKATWNALKSAIMRGFKKRLKKAGLFNEVLITIPAQIKEDFMSKNKILREGAVAAIKGNYNEALVMQFIYNYKGIGVSISNKYEKFRKDINATVSKWDKQLRDADKKNYNSNINIINKGSTDMANYLISNAVKEKGTIVGGYLDNLAFQDGIDFKADIRVAVIKEGEEILDGYSLKLYSSKSVGLANTTAKGLCGHLGGKSSADAFVKRAKNDKILIELINKAKKLNAVKQDHKKYLKGDLKALNRLKSLRGLTDAQIEQLDQKQIEAERKEARKPINPRVASIVYDIINSQVGTEEFGKRILDIMGFNDKETKMLMAITTDKKSQIIAKHPELDLKGITLEDPNGRVTLNIKGPTGKTILVFGVKEGEKKAVSGSVSFAGIEPEDYDEYL